MIDPNRSNSDSTIERHLIGQKNRVFSAPQDLKVGECHPMSIPSSSQHLETRKIGQLDVSVVGLGCNNFGWHIDKAATQRVVDAALEAGITLFDTADIYGDTESEVFLGRALGQRRDQAIIATKFGMKLDGVLPGGAKPETIKKAVEGSLTRLNTDVIDLYYLHTPDPDTPIQETLATLEELKKEGKIREYACSNFDAQALNEAKDKSAGSGFVAVQNEYSLLHRTPEDGVLEACAALNMAFVPYFPLKSGLLTGKYRQKQEPSKDSRLNAPTESKFAGMGKGLLTEENLAVVEKLIEFAERQDRTILELAFSWLLSQPTVASVIAGATKPEQIHANAQAAGWKLTADDLAEIDTITRS